jgi:hypothetical protein
MNAVRPVVSPMGMRPAVSPTPTAPAKSPVVAPAEASKPASTAPATAPAQNPIVLDKQGNQVMNKKELIEKIVVGEMGKDLSANMLTGKFQPEKTADHCLSLLKPHGIDAIYLSSQFTLDDMIRVAKGMKLPDAIRPYLERFHARVVVLAGGASKPVGESKDADSATKASVGAGSPAANGQQANSQ